MQFLNGQLLIAVPDLIDPNFFRSAVLIFQHNEDGAAGLVLNRPLNMSISEVCPDWEHPARDTPVYWGGPVTGPLMALHGSLSLGEISVIPGVFLSLQKSNLDRLVEQSTHPYRLYVGYSGWGAEQLESEMNAGGWLTWPASSEYVFSEDEQLWKSLCGTISSQLTVPGTGQPGRAVDPLWN